jgi:hypothetical protein
MFIINPLGLYTRDSLFSTHPKTENRIAALLAMEETSSRGDLPEDTPEQDENLPPTDDARDETADRTPNPWSEDFRKPQAGSGAPEKPAGKDDHNEIWGRRGAPDEPGESDNPDGSGTGRSARRKGPWS